MKAIKTGQTTPVPRAQPREEAPENPLHDLRLLVAQQTAREETVVQQPAKQMFQQLQRLAVRLREDCIRSDQRTEKARRNAEAADRARAEALKLAARYQREAERAHILADGREVLRAQGLEQIHSLMASIYATMPPDLVDGSKTRLGQLASDVLESLADIRATLRGSGRTIIDMPTIIVPDNPLLSLGAQRTLAYYGARGEDATDNLRAFLRSHRVKDIDTMVSMVWESLRTIRERSDIRGAESFANLVVDELSIEDADKRRISGFTTQAMITSQLLEQGRQLTGIEVALNHPITFNEWSVDEQSGLIGSHPTLFTVHLVDALENDKIIEIKRVNFDEVLGDLLLDLFAASLSNGSPTDETISFDRIKARMTAHHAVKITNQLVCNMLLIDAGVVGSLELHIVSAEPPHRRPVKVIHEFFDPSPVDIIWHPNAFSKGLVLNPSSI